MHEQQQTMKRMESVSRTAAVGGVASAIAQATAVHSSAVQGNVFSTMSSRISSSCLLELHSSPGVDILLGASQCFVKVERMLLDRQLRFRTFSATDSILGLPKSMPQSEQHEAECIACRQRIF